MSEKASDVMLDAMMQVRGLLILHCEIAESVTRANLQFMNGPEAYVVEKTDVDFEERNLRAVERLSVVLERLARAQMEKE